MRFSYPALKCLASSLLKCLPRQWEKNAHFLNLQACLSGESACDRVRYNELLLRLQKLLQWVLQDLVEGLPFLHWMVESTWWENLQRPIRRLLAQSPRELPLWHSRRQRRGSPHV